jgi:hypothetical protein
MKKMTTLAAAVALATVSASASSWWGNPWSDQTQMLDAQREYTEKLAAQQAQVQAAQRNYAEQLAADRARIAEQMAAQQAEAQAVQSKYAKQFVAAQARIAEHMAAQQSEAQAVQREYAKLRAAQQAQVIEAQRRHAEQWAANQPVPAQQADRQAVTAMLPPSSFADPFRGDPQTWASPLDPFGDPLSSVFEGRLKESEARREERRKTMGTRRTEMESRREAVLKKLEERRQARPHYVGLRKPFDRPTREEI